MKRHRPAASGVGTRSHRTGLRKTCCESRAVASVGRACHCSEAMPKSFHEKADPCQEFFALFHIFFVPQPFPSSRAASVATLPSALVVERVSLGAIWVFSIH